MAKQIPRLNAGSVAASVPSSKSGGDEAAGIVASFGKLADTGYAIAADAEKTLAEQQRVAAEDKQAVVNESAAGRRAGDYQESLTGYIEGLKNEFADAPDKAPGQLLEIGRMLEQAPNSAVGLAVAQRANAILNSAMKEMHTWALLRQTQMAKGDLQVTINRATAAAESQGSVAVLGAFIKAKEAELTPIFQKVLGADSVTAMKSMREDMARAWVLSTADKSPQAGISVLQALSDNKPGNPLVDYLDTTHRESLKKETISSIIGSTKTGYMNTIKGYLGSNKNLIASWAANDPGLGAAFEAKRKALEAEKIAVKAQLSVDSSALKALGVDVQGHSPEEVVGLIDTELKFVDALKNVRKLALPFDAEDDPTSVEGLMLATEKALKPKNGKDLGIIIQQQARLAVALNDKKISGSTAQTIFKTMSLALDTAAANNEDVDGPNTWRLWRAPFSSGTVELNRQFAGQFSKLDKASQVRARMSYVGQFNAAQEAGQQVTVESARQMALRALALEVGEPIPGVK
jgi:hypothetical protein